MKTFTEWLIVEGKDLSSKLMARFPDMRRILMSFGIAPMSLVYLGQGDKGSAFGAGHLIVKITEDAREARASAHLVGRDLKGVVKILYVGKFANEFSYKDLYDDEPIKTQYYMIIQEKLNSTVSPKIKLAADAVGDYVVDKWIPRNMDYKIVADNILKSGQGRVLADKDSRDIVISLLKSFDILRKNGIEYLDISGDNIGFDSSGRLSVFDLGISNSAPVMDMPEIR